MIPLQPPPAMPATARLLLSAAFVLATLPVARGQEYELKNGRRIPAASVKIVPEGFSAAIPSGANTYETVTFTTKDILRVTLPEPKLITQAQVFIATGKTDEAIAAAEACAKEYESIKFVPGAWWGNAMLVQMDALAAAGKGADVRTLVDNSTLNRLPEGDSKALQEFIEIVGDPKADPEERLRALKRNSDSASTSWLAARTWIEMGTLLLSRGRVEESIKAWLRVPAFYASESDLALRGTVAAARALQQIERAEDGMKILKDYLVDNPVSPYTELIQTEIAKLTPKKKTKQPAEGAPEEPAKEEPAKEETDNKPN